MPTYEYRCENCNRNFTLKMSMAEHEDQQVSCPNCQQRKIVPQYATFFPKTTKKSTES